MKKNIYIVEGLTCVKVNPPNGAYHEEFVVGRYTIKGILLPNCHFFYVFKGNELKAIISKDDWYISKLDGEGQNLLNRLIRAYW